MESEEATEDVPEAKRVKISDRLKESHQEINDQNLLDSSVESNDPETSENSSDTQSDDESDSSLPVFIVGSNDGTKADPSAECKDVDSDNYDSDVSVNAGELHATNYESEVSGPCDELYTKARELTTVSYSDIAEKEEDNRPDTEQSVAVKAHSPLSPEEKERYAFISEQLSILNKASETHAKGTGKLSDHKKWFKSSFSRVVSPRKSMSPFRKLARGIKRSKRKLPIQRLKRPRLQKTSGDAAYPPAVRDSVVDSDNSDGTSSDENAWTILEEESETEMDQKLSDKAENFALSAVNVKSILHKIITNESVVEMVRNAVTEDDNDVSGSVYEPKMTRSKVKEVMETKGSVPHPWGLSPLKMPPRPEKAAFLDIDLPEDEEEDEDFNPDKAVHYSDEDSESVVSSCISDFGSPMPSTPTTPAVTPSTVCRDVVTDSESSQTFLSPMGPPPQGVKPRSTVKSSLGQKYQAALAEDDRRRAREEEKLIASRTRSKCPLTDTSLLELEANFIAPDITTDMYDTMCDDKDWQGFLQSLIKIDPTREVTEVTEDDDPEYNYLDEADGDDEYDTEDFRCDRAVKVSRKEVNLLMDELYEAYGDGSLDENSKHAIVAQSDKIRLAEKHRQNKNLVFQISDHERRQIHDQMRKHVQLLAQTYVLSRGNEECEASAQLAKMYLRELATFSVGSEMVLPLSAYRSCNLEEALTIMNTDDWWDHPSITADEINRMRGISYKHDTLKLPPLLPSQIAIMWNSPVFMYQHMLPHGGVYKQEQIKKDRSRIKFLECEDNLLAMGLEQFGHLSQKYDYIQSFLLPTKIKRQILIRIKNLSCKTAKNNVVKYFREHKALPPFPRYDLYYDNSMMKAPRDQKLAFENLPNWCQVFRDDLDLQDGCCSTACPLRQSTSLAVAGTDINTCPTHACSAPVTPQTKGAFVSSGSSGRSTGSVPGKPRQKRRGVKSKRQLDLAGSGAAPLHGTFVPLGNVQSTCVINQPNSDAIPINVSLLNTAASLHTSSAATTYLINPSLPVSTNTIPGVVQSTSVAPTIILINGLGSVHTPNACTTTTSVMLTHPSVLPTNPQATTPGINSPVSQTVSGQGLSDDRFMAHSDRDLQSLSMPVIHDSSLNSTEGLVDCSVNSQISKMDDDVNNKEISDLNNKSYSLEGASDNSSTTGPQGDSGCGVHRTNDSLDLLSSAMQVSDIPVSMELCNGGTSQTPASQPESGANISSRQQSVVQPSTSETYVMSMSQTPAGSRSQTPVNVHEAATVQECNCVLTSDKHTSTHNPSTPRSATPVPTPLASKSALEIVASYAPYFLPQSSGSNYGDQQKLQETTPTKTRYRPVAPKPASVGKKSPAFVGGIKPPCRSRQRRKLQQKARSILPKGFIPRTFGSPTKKAASSLIDKAKHHGKNRGDYCNILPRPARQIPPPEPRAVSIPLAPVSSGQSDGVDDEDSDPQKDNASTASDYDTLNSEIDDDDDDGDDDDDDEGNDNNNNADLGLDTESDVDTQSEDDMETQDDLDSQDDDEHIANLMEASTTLRFDRTKEDIQRSKLDKKHRNRETRLAMLSPDLVDSDAFRDDRDTAFAQAYLTKVKKVLRDDLDIYEKFLRIMYEFSKTEQSPIKLYAELTSLFERWPDLLDDFSGFLLPEQASVCGCSRSYQEFVKARSFLRKLEVCFSRAPVQFQKLMKIFSRWFRKSGHDLDNLRDQVEPMLKGQTMILEEFSRFFPDAQPPESMMDDFEEVNIDGSGDDNENGDIDTRLTDGFEEIELPDEPDILGTKRCPCQCHDTKDDTYMKRKKHCYQCCLTVMDGELVYKVNNKTIKKVNVTFGPPVTPADLTSDKDAPIPVDGDTPGLTTTTTTADRKLETIQLATENQEPAETDWLTDSETAEKENIEHYRDDTSHSQDSREATRNRTVSHHGRKPAQSRTMPRQYLWKKSSFFQRIGRLSRSSRQRSKNIRLSSVLKSNGKGPQSSSKGDNDANSLPDKSPTKSSDSHVETIDKGNETESVEVTNDSEDFISYKSRSQCAMELFGSPSSSPETVSDCSSVSDSDKSYSGTLSDSSGDEMATDKAWSVGSESPIDEESHVMEIADIEMKPVTPEQIESKHNDSDKHLEKTVEINPSVGALEASSVKGETVAEEAECDEIGQRTTVDASSNSNLANEILVRAFNTVLHREVSMDTSLPEAPILATKEPDSNVTKDTEINPNNEALPAEKVQENATNDVQTKSVTVVGQQDPITGQSAFPISTIYSTDAPTDNNPASRSSSPGETYSSMPVVSLEGSTGLTVSRNSSFSKVNSKTKFTEDEDNNLPFASKSCTVSDESSSLSSDKDGVDDKPTKQDSSASNINAADKQELQKSVAPVSPFGPFSPFGQEIQNIIAGKSPLAYNVQSPDNSVTFKRQSTTKLRRITPIPVKGSSLQSDGQSLSAFETVAKNSPLLFEAPIMSVASEKPAVSFENLNLQLEDSKSNGSVCLKSVRTPTPSSNETPGSESNSMKSGETNLSQKSDGVVSCGSQESDKSATGPISLTQPMAFSEDANEGFIKPAIVVSSSDIQSSKIISDESLIGVFMQNPEELNSISNLTNIFHHYENHSTTINQLDGSQLPNQPSSINSSEMEVSVKSPIKQPNEAYVPQSSTSKENQARLENMDIKVSSLSDSDSNSKDKTVDNEMKSETTESPCFMGQVLVSVKLSDISIESTSLLDKPGYTSDTVGYEVPEVSKLSKQGVQHVNDTTDKTREIIHETDDKTGEIKDERDSAFRKRTISADKAAESVGDTITTNSKGDLKSVRQMHKKSQKKLDSKSVNKEKDKSVCETVTDHNPSSNLPVQHKPVETVPKTKKTVKSLEAVVERIRSSTTVSEQSDDTCAMDTSETPSQPAHHCSSTSVEQSGIKHGDTEHNSNVELDPCPTRIVKVHKGQVELSPKYEPACKRAKISSKISKKKGTMQNKRSSDIRQKETGKSDPSERVALQEDNKHNESTSGQSVRTPTESPNDQITEQNDQTSSKLAEKVSEIKTGVEQSNTLAGKVDDIKTALERNRKSTGKDGDIKTYVERNRKKSKRNVGDIEISIERGSKSTVKDESKPAIEQEVDVLSKTSTPVVGSQASSPVTSGSVEESSTGTESTPLEGSESQEAGISAEESVMTGAESGSSVTSDEGDPQWTMELDRIILEGCKAQGISDATFARLAEEIGNVTQQQVQARFQFMYQEILSKMLGHDSHASS